MIRDAITPKTKTILLTTPHNPTGTVLEQADWEELADIDRIVFLQFTLVPGLRDVHRGSKNTLLQA